MKYQENVHHLRTTKEVIGHWSTDNDTVKLINRSDGSVRIYFFRIYHGLDLLISENHYPEWDSLRNVMDHQIAIDEMIKEMRAIPVADPRGLELPIKRTTQAIMSNVLYINGDAKDIYI